MTARIKSPKPDPMAEVQALVIRDAARTAVGCTRLSDRELQGGYGEAEQTVDIEREAASLRLPLAATIHETERGTKEDRAHVEAYLWLAERYPGLHFVFPRVDRIGRRARLILGIVDDLHARRARVHVVGIPLDLRTKEGQLMLGTLANLAQFDHSHTVQNLTRGKLAKAKDGLWAQGKPPFWLRIVRDHRGRSTTLEPNEHWATVERIARLSLDGHGLRTIAKQLNAEGLPTPEGTPWREARVHYVLRSPALHGEAVLNRDDPERRVVIPIPAVITPAEHAELLRGLASRTKHQPKDSQRALFAGFLRCASCGYSMRMKTQQNATGPRVYYFCVLPSRSGRPCPHRKHHRADLLDVSLWDELAAQLADPAALAAMIDQPQDHLPDHTARIQGLREQIKGAVRRAALVGLTDEELGDIVRPWRAEIAHLEEEMRPQMSGALDVGPLLKRVGAAMRVASSGGLKERRALLKALGVVVTVGPDGPEKIVLQRVEGA